MAFPSLTLLAASSAFQVSCSEVVSLLLLLQSFETVETGWEDKYSNLFLN